MPNRQETLERAAKRVEREQSCLRTECEELREFRVAVGVARPGRSDDPGSGADTERLVESYRETVTASRDVGAAHGGSLGEVLRVEFGRPIADALLSGDELTHRLKRDLLLAINDAIERRQRIRDLLRVERKSLEKTRDELVDIERTLRELPVCSFRALPFEEFVVTWERYGALTDRCERLSQNRQFVVRELHDSPRMRSHALNEHLYGDLRTTYPGLRAITEAYRAIRRNRQGIAGKSPDAGRDGREDAPAVDR